jgi:hypothetical protein
MRLSGVMPLQKWASGYAAPDYVTMLQLSFGWATSVGYPYVGTTNATFPIVVTELEALLSSPEVRAQLRIMKSRLSTIRSPIPRASPNSPGTGLAILSVKVV